MLKNQTNVESQTLNIKSPKQNVIEWETVCIQQLITRLYTLWKEELTNFGLDILKIDNTLELQTKSKVLHEKLAKLEQDHIHELQKMVNMLKQTLQAQYELEKQTLQLQHTKEKQNLQLQYELEKRELQLQHEKADREVTDQIMALKKPLESLKKELTKMQKNLDQDIRQPSWLIELQQFLIEEMKLPFPILYYNEKLKKLNCELEEGGVLRVGNHCFETGAACQCLVSSYNKKYGTSFVLY